MHLVGAGGWSDERVLAKVREMVLQEIEHGCPVQDWHRVRINWR